MPITTFKDNRENLDYRRSQRLSMRSGGIIGNWVTSGLSAAGAAAANVLYATPIYLPDTCRVDALICSVTVGSAGNMRMGLYTDLNGYPDTRLFVATEITTVATAGLKYQAVGMTLPYGFYWAACVFDSTPTMQEDDNGASGQTMGPWLGGDSATDVTVHPGINVAFTYAALPTPFTASAAYSSTTQPRILLRIGKIGRRNDE